MSTIIFDINDVERLRRELRLTNEYAEQLEERVAHLEDQLRYERDPSAYNLQKGHSHNCIRVFSPRSFCPCNCGLVERVA